MDSNETSNAQILLAFQERFWSDQADKKNFGMTHYLAIWPDHETIIAKAYLEAVEPSTETTSSSSLHHDDEEQLGPYVLGKELGRGGQGVVHKATDTRLNRTVALKILTGFGLKNAEQLQRFRKEAEIASKLNHPGICGVHDAGIENGVAFIAMQFVQGSTLASKISETSRQGRELKTSLYVDFDDEQETPKQTAKPQSGSTTPSTPTPSSQRAVLKILEQCARALHVAHEAGVLHRDIKPGNIMVTDDGRPIILDFGLAKDTADDGASLTVAGDLMGTPAYMSPEQLAANRIRIDRRSDVYSLGVTLFECLTSKRPFEEPTREALYNSILTATPPSISSLAPRVSKDLAIVVETAMARNRDDRYQTALDLAEDLRRVRELKPIAARPASGLKKSVRWVQRNPVVTISLIGLVIASLITAGVFYLKGEEARHSMDIANAASAKAFAAFEREKHERERKESALSEVERLSDITRLEQAEESAKSLWPARPEKIKEMKDWLARYHPLLEALMVHKAYLEGLGLAIRLTSEEESSRDAAAELRKVDTLKVTLSQLESRIAKAKDPKAKASLQDEAKKIQNEIAEFEKENANRISRGLGDDEVKRWKFETASRIVVGLEKFSDPKSGTYADVQNRLASAQTLGARTITDHQECWDKAIDAIKASARYDGLVLKPQLGLIPLGMDPQSGLFEFLHLETHKGAIPERGQDGTITMTEDTGIILVLIPKGEFWMGSQKRDPNGKNYDPQSRADEILREVEIVKPFFLSKYEMTQGQWQRSPASNKTPSDYGVGFGKHDPLFKNPVNLKHPVEQVSWTMCTTVLRRIGLDLPTEEQWEYAARAGSTSIFVGGTNRAEDLSSWGNIAGLETKGFYSTAESSHRDDYIIHGPVGKFRANAFGLFDVLGNVWEWTSTLSGSADRVSKGGSFNIGGMSRRIAIRSRCTEKRISADLGLRPCMFVTF